MSSSSRGRGRGRGRGGGGGGWGRDEWRQGDQESPRASQQPQQHHRSSSDARRARGAVDWASQQAGCSMQQLRLQPQQPQQRAVLQQQQPVVALATSRGVQHVQQGGLQQLQQGSQQQQPHGGRQQNRNRTWSNGAAQHQHQQQQRNPQHVQHVQQHHQAGGQHHHKQRPVQQTQQLQQRQQAQLQQHQRPVQQSQQLLLHEQQHEQRREAKRGKRRRQTSGFYQGRAAEQHGAAAAAAAAAAADPDELPGFTRCPETGKYFRITADSSGLVGHRSSDVRAAERRKREEDEERQRREQREEEERRKPARRPASTLALLSALSLGKLAGPCLPRAAAAARMQQLPQAPTQVIDVTDFLPLSRYAGMHSVVGCEFLDVAADGETLTGCWAVAGSSGGRSASMACSVRASVAERGGGGRREREKEWLALGSLRGAPVQVRASAIVDMAMAPTDRDVTCLLYATATSTLDKWGCPTTVCDVSTRPVCCRFEEGDYDVSDSSIYNLQARVGGRVYSCAWSQKSMKIGIGFEKYAHLIDVMTEQVERVGTKGRVTLSQAFDESGDTLFLGLRAVDACVMDMRASMERAAAIMPDSRNTGWLRLLHKSGPQVVLSTLEGKLCLYDIRRPCVPLLSYGGHRVGQVGARLPSFVDNDEQFVFAVGTDFTTRVWSLASGKLLHELQEPAAAAGAAAPTDYPRPVYSTRWSGTPGQGALLVAAGTHVNVYRLGADEEEW